VVIMQLISVYIRLNAYGFTEARYYVALFGIFSIACGILLSIRPVTKNGIIALMAAGFAIFSILPPVDAFTVSRVSQITRLETMLSAEGILTDGKINPKSDVPLTLRLETTSILNYLENRSYAKYVTWLPADFRTNNNMQSTFGFEPAYENIGGDQNFFFASLDTQKPLNINGYDMMFNINANRMDKVSQPKFDFEVRGAKYILTVERLSPQEAYVSVKDANGAELVGTGLYDFTKTLSSVSNSPKEAISPENMTLNVEKNGYRLRIMLQNVNMTYSGADAGVDYNAMVMFGAPAK